MIDAQRFARLVTDAVVRRPRLWRFFRGPLRSTLWMTNPLQLEWIGDSDPEIFLPVIQILRPDSCAPAPFCSSNNHPIVEVKSIGFARFDRSADYTAVRNHEFDW